MPAHRIYRLVAERSRSRHVIPTSVTKHAGSKSTVSDVYPEGAGYQTRTAHEWMNEWYI